MIEVIFRNMKAHNIDKTLSFFKLIKSGFLILLSVFFLISCVPSEKSLTQESIDGDTTFGGFTGVNVVQTLSANQVRVSWVRSPLDKVVSYNIYNATLPTAPVLLKTVDADTTSTTISGLNRNILYRFRVKAVDDLGNEDININDAPGIPYGGATSVSVVSSTSAQIFYSTTSGGEALNAAAYCFTNINPGYQLYESITDMSLSSVIISGLQTNTQYTCKVNVSVDGIEDNNLQTVNFTALGSADRLVFLTQPGNAAAGDLLNVQPVVHVLDENNNIVSGGPDATALITLEISTASPTGGTVRGTFAINAVAGVATFNDIFFEEAGSKILTAKKSDTSSLSFGTPVMTVNSNAFNITPGAVHPDFTTITIDPPIQPPFDALVANGTDSYQVIFNLKDRYGNAVPGVRPQFSSSVPGDFLNQPLLSTNALGVTSGSISTTTADTNPARTLNITSPAGLTGIAVAAPFKAGSPSRLAFIIQPQNSPAGNNGMNEIQVAVQDAQGNLISSGPSSIGSIALSISNNVGAANLTGTHPKNAVGGLATFSNLGIDQTGSGFRLVASSGALSPATSNNFNITAGIPRVISMQGASSVRSGQCSSAITLQLRDFGGNPSKATTNTTVQLTGLGTSLLYSSSTCGGAALSTNVTFTPGTDTRTVYLRNNKSLALNIVASDSSAVLTPANYTLNVTPSKISVLAEAAPPAAPGSTLTVLSGECSTKIVISPLAEDNSAGQVFGATNILMTGITGSDAKIYSNDTCTTEISPAGFPMSQGVSPNNKTLVYLKDPKGENLVITASDPLGNIATISPFQDVKVLASKIIYSGPSSVVAGQCSTAFTIRLRDTLNNNVPADRTFNLNVNGVQGASSTGRFYTSASCSGGGSNTSVTVPEGSSTVIVYFKGQQAEILNIFISDQAGLMSQSATRQLTISPSGLRITAPAAPASSLTSACRGPFRVETLDGDSTVAPVVANTIVNLTGAGAAAGFYNDSICEIGITSVTFLPGQSSKTFYFKGQYPEAPLTLTATDNAAVLTPATQAWSVIGDWGWLGTDSTQEDAGGNLLPFRMGLKPVSARYDGIRGAQQIAFTPNKQFLFVADADAHRIIKYDYQNLEYRGWIGRMLKENGIGSNGSKQPVPSNALCISTNDNQDLPGWCVGGRSRATGSTTTGGLYQPWGLVSDDTYVYVSNVSGDSVTRHRVDTGAFDGWIGQVNNSTPSGTGTGGAAGCTSVSNGAVTPGWCIGGNQTNNDSRVGDGRMLNPQGLEIDNTFLYVGVAGAVLRYNKTTGAFQGWIGMVDNTPSSGSAGCTLSSRDQLTPGWCFGGSYKSVNARSQSGVQGGVREARDIIINGTNMYVLNSGDGGVINRYNKDTGAFVERLPNLNFTWTNPQQFSFDGTYFYVSDDERILKVGTTGLIESWMGKVSNNSGMSGNAGCSSLQPNDNTPGWCLGGSHKPGLGERSFLNNYGIAFDGAGSFLAISREFAMLKKFSTATGVYQGAIGLESKSPKTWTSDRTKPAEFYGLDDNSMYSPVGSLVVGDFLFVTEREGSRVKKISKNTGQLVGWIGGITSVPTGGQTAGCLSANAMGPSPSWCLGASSYPTFTWNDNNLIDDLVDGIMYRPQGLASDGTWLYITDNSLHRIQRFRVDSGSYGGWIGRISTSSGSSPTGGAAGCSGASSGTFTPGWCFGGRSTSGSEDGMLNSPGGMTYYAGSLFVIDISNHRVSKYNATTGNFEGWIGRVNSNPTSGCGVASNGDYNIANGYEPYSGTTGWCFGGTSRAGTTRSDNGGGFFFENSNETSSIHTDGVFLFVTNTRNNRVDRFNINNGTFHSAARTREDTGQYSNTWETGRTNVNNVGNSSDCSRPISIWVDTNFIYGLNSYPCQRESDGMSLWKMDKATGNMVGWKGGISSSVPPTGGDPGCVGATASTPGWCQGGRIASGVLLGQWSGIRGMISGDANYLYVTDGDANRVVRVPK